MMQTRPLRDLGVGKYPLQNPVCIVTVPLHAGPLLGGQTARLIDNILGNPQLADIVQQTGNFHLIQIAACYPQIQSQLPGNLRDSLRMLLGIRAFRIHHPREQPRHFPQRRISQVHSRQIPPQFPQILIQIIRIHRQPKRLTFRQLGKCRQ